MITSSYRATSVLVLACWLSCCVALHSSLSSGSDRGHNASASSSPNQKSEFYQAAGYNRAIGRLSSGFLNHAAQASPCNETVTGIKDAFSEPATGRSTETLYLASLLKIVWQFVNGIAKPFLKTYLAPIQLLFTYMAPKMFLKDCFNVDTAALLSARTLSPFTIQPAAQAFFVCAVDIIAQVILCVKLLANMATSIF